MNKKEKSTEYLIVADGTWANYKVFEILQSS